MQNLQVGLGTCRPVGAERRPNDHAILHLYSTVPSHLHEEAQPSTSSEHKQLVSVVKQLCSIISLPAGPSRRLKHLEERPDHYIVVHIHFMIPGQCLGLPNTLPKDTQLLLITNSSICKQATMSANRQLVSTSKQIVSADKRLMSMKIGSVRNVQPVSANKQLVSAQVTSVRKQATDVRKQATSVPKQATSVRKQATSVRKQATTSSNQCL